MDHKISLRQKMQAFLLTLLLVAATISGIPPVQVSADGKQFMKENSPRESARWQEGLAWLCNRGWVKPCGTKGQVFEVTGTGYKKADWLKDAMEIDTDVEPVEEIKNFE